MSKLGKSAMVFLACGLAPAFVTAPSHAQSVPGLRGPLEQPSLLDSGQANLEDLNENTFDDGFVSNSVATDDSQQQTLDPTTTASPTPRPSSSRSQQPAQRATAAGPVFNPLDPDGGQLANTPANPVQTGNPSTVEEDPFAPTGFRIGTIEANATLDQSIGYSSNVSQEADGEGGAFSQTDLDLQFTSNWSRHQWQTNVGAGYRRPFDSEEIDRPEFNIDSSLRLDLIDGFTVTGRGFYNAQTQSFTSSTLAPGAVDNPLQQSYGGSLELQRTDRKLQLTLRGEIERDQFSDADLGGGVTQSQDDRNNDEYRLTARIGYETSPALTPFVEGSYAIRDFEQEVDRNGNRRDSEILELRGGLQVDLGEKLNGEISVGYVQERFDDPLLDNLTGFSVDGLINWSPERDTDITLTLGTQTNDSISANENGSFLYNARLDYQRQITNRFSVNAFADAQIETNEDNDTTLQIGIGTEYWVNRFMALTTQVDHLTFESDDADSSFEETTGRVGVRLQR